MPASIASLGFAQRLFLPLDEELARDGVAVRVPEDAFRELGPARAHEACEADDLALPELEIYAFEDIPALAWRIGLPVPGLEDDLVGYVARPSRVYVVDLASDHVLDYQAFRHLALMGVESADGLPVAQHGDRVRDPDHFLELVGDEDTGDPAVPEPFDYLEQIVAVVLVESRRGLVQDEQLDVAAQGLGDLDELLLADAEVPDLRRGVEVQPDLLEHLGRLLDRRVPIDRDSVLDLVAEEDVLINRELGNEGELLVDDRDAGLLAVRDAPELLDLAAEDDVARIVTVRVNAAQHLHEVDLPAPFSPTRPWISPCLR